MISEGLIEAYHATTYQIELVERTLSFRAGERSAPVELLVASLGVREWAFISACNPRSQLLLDAENKKRHLLLKELLHMLGCRYFEGSGISDAGDWPREQGLFVVGISLEQAVALGRIFEQNAIMFCSVDSVPHVVKCLGKQ